MFAIFTRTSFHFNFPPFFWFNNDCNYNLLYCVVFRSNQFNLRTGGCKAFWVNLFIRGLERKSDLISGIDTSVGTDGSRTSPPMYLPRREISKVSNCVSRPNQPTSFSQGDSLVFNVEFFT